MKHKILLISTFLLSILSVKSHTYFGEQQVITRLADVAKSVYAVDLDGDGDKDILSASSGDSKIAWYENTNGAGTFGEQQIITSSANYAQSVYTTDIDGDGDQDVLSASEFDDKIAWYENTDGTGTFGTQQVITTSADEARSVYAADLDGDGDMDILSASFGDDKIAWYENINGAGTFGIQQVITTLADGAKSVYAVDLDGDGDKDVLSASWNDDKIAWYENTNGTGTFGVQQVITTLADGANSVYAADLDGDDDLDIISASYHDNEITWYENTDGTGIFSTQQVITSLADGAWSVHAADIDGDGDQDILSATCDDDKLSWYENTDGIGTFSKQQVITTLANCARSAYAVDIDGDGNQDILSASMIDDKIAWYKNLALSSIEELRPTYSKEVSVFPNPTTGIITFDFAGNYPEKLMIADIIGKLLMEKKQLDAQTSINISGFESGTYIVTIQLVNEVVIRKIVKE